MSPILVIFAKEVRDNFRDRRSLLSALIYPLLGPLLFAALLSAMTEATGLGVGGGTQRVPTVGAEHAPDLTAFLGEKGIQAKAPPADIEAAIREGRVRAVIMIPADFANRIERGETATVRVVSDSSSLQGELLAGRIARILAEYGRQVAADRLEAIGVSPDLMEPVFVENVILEKRRSAADLFLFMVPPFIMFTVFIGGVYLAIDATSGERERGSLEPLMASPVPRWHFMLGKFLAAYLFTAIALGLQLGGFGLVFHTVGAGKFSEGIGLDLPTILYLAVIALPLMAFTVAVQIIIAASTRSFKEAQTWLGLLPMVPAVPGLAMVFLPVNAKLWMMAVPVFAQTVGMAAVVRGQGLPLEHFLLGSLSTLIAAGLLLSWAARMFEREEMIFGGA